MNNRKMLNYQKWLFKKGIPDRAAGITTSLTENKDSRFLYPWNGLEERLQDKNGQFIMIGYGSLLNPSSAARTIADTPPDGQTPVIAWGAKRLFDYVIPPEVLERYGEPAMPDQIAALNTVWTGQITDFLNGRAIELAIEDLPGLRKREVDYDLMPVSWLPWNDPNSQIQSGFVLCAKQDSGATNKQIRSFPPYTKVCAEGAKIVDSDFEDCFWESTFQANGKTPEPRL